MSDDRPETERGDTYATLLFDLWPRACCIKPWQTVFPELAGSGRG